MYQLSDKGIIEMEYLSKKLLENPSSMGLAKLLSLYSGVRARPLAVWAKISKIEAEAQGEGIKK